LPDIKPIKLTETDKDAYKAGVGSIILLTIGMVLSLSCLFLLVGLSDQTYTDDFTPYILFFLYSVTIIVGFILFTIGWFLYARKKMHILSRFGWWILLIAAWFEIFFIDAWISWVHCYGYTPADCEHVHDINAIPYCLVPGLFMLFGLALVYIGKKKQKNQNISLD
jgi:hypothetical protein